MAKLPIWARNIIAKSKAFINAAAQNITRLWHFLVRHKWWCFGIAIVAFVLIGFWQREYFACAVGYVSTDSGMNPGARFFRDVVLLSVAIVGISIAAWRNRSLDSQSKAANEQAKAANKQADTAANQFGLAEKRLLSDQFASAAELMAKETKRGKPAISARVGGIYIMETLAKSAPKEFVEQVVKNLIAYIKGHIQLTATPELKNGESPEYARMLGEDVKSAFAALHNILSDVVIKEIKIGDAILDFSHQDFSYLDLSSSQVNLSHYKNWTMTDFTSSFLHYANFEGAYLLYAKLIGAHLNNAVLIEANLFEADMTNAILTSANLRGAKLESADLSGADLRRAQMQGANLLKTEFKNPFGDKTTRYGYLDWVKLDGARLEDCNLPDLSMHKISLRGAVISGGIFGGAYTSGVQFGETCIFVKDFPPASVLSVKNAMDGKIWHLGADWAQGIKECPDDIKWDLEQYKDGYALAGILNNFARDTEGKFNSINLRKQARKLLDDDNLPKNTPLKCRKWLARIDPATGLLPAEKVLLDIFNVSPEPRDAQRTKQD